MKKALIALFLFFVLTVTSVFIFIPSQLHISSATIIKTNTNALYRYLSDDSKWTNWWPQQGEKNRLNNKNPYWQLNHFTYRLSNKLYNAADVDIISKDKIINSKIFIIPLAEDSLIVKWQSDVATSGNPFTRIWQYRQAVNIKENMTAILNSLKSFSEDKQKVYRFNIHHVTLKDTFYISEKTVTTGYPSTSTIYKSISNLREYVQNENAAVVGSSILNITRKDSIHYNMMVAVPINKILNGNGKIAFKRMIVYKDKILTAEVRGGLEKINEAYDELNTYIKDYNLAVPVIGWETLVTDRSKETDSTKWITKICVPIA